MALLDLKADVTGAIWRITATPGQRVSAGDTLLIMESMKMEIPLLSPEDGTLREIFVKEGEIANEGDIVARMEDI